MGFSKRELRNRLKEAEECADRLERRVYTLEARLDIILRVINNARSRLESAFGKLSYVGLDEGQRVMRFVSDDGLAAIDFKPATLELRLSDPQGAVDDISLVLEGEYLLDRSNREIIRRFLADVTYSRSSDAILETRTTISLATLAEPPVDDVAQMT
jgi:hypothetical protein